MCIENHSLHNEFPQHNDRIRQLKMNDRHFVRLFEEYHDTDREIRKIEEGAEASSDARLEGLKMRRVHLKDDLLGMLETVDA
ncbi:MAG: DUF465 domain-containing protein [Oleispira sp.]|nr:DUF465 domain-containing protein [Oleispira sp.]MBL4882340.1 DUF465 domain-containing protein [Oleispira sp.]